MALCHHSEGWGPVSKQRPFDLTPCFEDGALVGGSLAFLFLGAILRTYQLRSKEIRHNNVKTRRWLAMKLVNLPC